LYTVVKMNDLSSILHRSPPTAISQYCTPPEVVRTSTTNSTPMLSDGTVQYLADNTKVNVFLRPCKNSLPDRSDSKKIRWV
jgi:hypothetical protein